MNRTTCVFMLGLASLTLAVCDFGDDDGSATSMAGSGTTAPTAEASGSGEMTSAGSTTGASTSESLGTGTSVDTELDTGSTTGAAESEDSETGATTQTSSGMVDIGDLPSLAVDLSDAQMLEVLNAFNRAEIDLSGLAVMRATSPDVTAFAQMVIGRHTTAQGLVDMTVTTLAITPEANDVATAWMDASAGTMVQLQSVETDFDATFMRSQISMHMDALAVIEAMTTGADAAELNTLLGQFRGAMSGHLAMANGILTGLE